MNKVKIFENFLSTFETEKFRNYCQNMIEEIPDYIFEIPASTTLKYHNKTQCQPHGQIIHMLMLCKIMNYRLELDWNKEKFDTPIIRDMLRCGAVFHDALKCGKEQSKYSLFEHPILSGEWVRNTAVEHDIDSNYKEYIAELCESHSGQYNTSTRSKIILPKPKTEAQFFLHECDVLASRSDLDMILGDELNEFDDVNNSQQNQPFTPHTEMATCIEEYKMPFGKYKNWLILDIAKVDIGYIEWLDTLNDLDSTIKHYVEQILK